MKLVLIVALIVAAVVAVAILLMPSGPRITQITRRREREDEPEDRD
jgi:hypothetical protein